MASFSIIQSEAQTVVDDMTWANGLLSSSLETLNAAVTAYQAVSQGAAKDAYSDAQSAWNTGQQEMNDSLRNGQARLTAIIAAYVHGDVRGAGLFS
jgi:uncharacterized protein YukE